MTFIKVVKEVLPNSDSAPTLTDSIPAPIQQTNVDYQNLEIIDLSSYPLSQTKRELLQLYLSFCPNSISTKFDIIKDLHLFSRKLTYKYMFDSERQNKQTDISHQKTWKNVTVSEFRALRDMV